MIEWSLSPIFSSYTLAVVVTAGLALLLAVGPTFGRLSTLRRGSLIVIRCAIILLLLAAMLRPTRVYTTTKQQTAVLLLLLDQSRSMTLASETAGQTRWEAQQETLRQLEDELANLAKDFEIRAYSYDEELYPLALDRGKLQLPAAPTGDQTDIGTTLHDALQRELGKRVIGVIAMGDGTQTAFTPRVELTEAGREMARLEYPLYTVVWGPLGDVTQARDLAIENLPEQYTVFVKNEMQVKGLLRARGYVNQELDVELIAEGPNLAAQRVAITKVVSRQDDELLPIELNFTPATPGQYKLALRTPEQPGELVTRNNELSAFVTVLDGGLRVLYLYGDLVGEQRLLRRSINLSPDIQLDDVFVDPKNRDRWPIKLGDELQPANVDVLLIENVDAAALGDANLQSVATLVEAGKGLIMIGGFNSFGPGGYRGTPLADALPIELARFERQDAGLEAPINRDLHWWGELPLVPTQPHPVITLATTGDNAALWQSLPPLKGANKFAQLKPRARVLLETPDRKPVLVADEFGRGRVLAFAGNSTARWWQQGRQAEHRRFWRQVVLWLARRDNLEQHDVWIKLAQRRFNPGTRATFEAGAKSATGETIRDAAFTAELVLPDGTRRPIRLSANGETQSGVIDDISTAGDYLVELSVARQAQTLGSARATFQVLDRDAELSNPAAGHEAMARLAEMTKAFGGQALAPEQLPDLLRSLRERREELQVEVQVKWQLGDTALDAWLFVIAVVSLLTSEWVLRKRWGLV